MGLTYTVITPARNEEENLHRLVPCLTAQTVAPVEWLVVDNGSTDGTAQYVEEIARTYSWIRLVTAEPGDGLARGAPIVRAFHRGLEVLGHRPDIVVKLDADVSIEPDYFERLLAEFERDPRIGIASGGGYEVDGDGTWKLRAVAPVQAWGASRAYRWECLEAVLPLEEAMGWDGIDQVKAHAHGWWTGTIASIPFKHHRYEGERDGDPAVGWAAQGRASHYMGYRFSYLLMRSLHHARRDRAALALVRGYVAAAVSRSPRADVDVRRRLRRQQSLRAMAPQLRKLLASGGPARSVAGDRR